MPSLCELGIRLRNSRPGQHRAPCPKCAKRRRDGALGVLLGADGSFVAHCFRCGWTARSGRSSAKTAPAAPIRSAAPRERLAPLWAGFWADCQPLRGTLAQAYLTWRGCFLPPEDGHLRFHPKVWHWPARRHLPALVALLTDAIDGTWRSLHFTFLDESGSRKASVEPPRLLLPGHRKQGAVCRLWPDEAVTTGLAVGEGIETALAGAHAFRPAWACVDAGNLTVLPVLAGVEALTIFADHDLAGIDAARRCAARWSAAGREARLVMSARPGADLADEVLNGDR